MNKKNVSSKQYQFLCFCFAISFVFFFFTDLNAYAQAFKRLAKGQPAPEFSLKDINNVEISTASFKNKKVLALVFFKNPSLRGEKALNYWNELYRTFQIANDFEALAIYVPRSDDKVSQEELDEVKKIIDDHKISFPVLIDQGMNIFNKFGVIALPSSTIIDKEGISQYILPGFPEFGAERDIKKNLKKILGIPEEIIAKEEKYKPKNKADFSVKLAMAVHKRGNTQKAIHHMKTALSKDPDYAFAHSYLAKLYVQEGNQEEAIKSFRKSLSLNPNDTDTLLSYGFLCMDMGKKDDALLQFTNILELDPKKSAEGYFGMSTIYMQNKIFDSAKIKVEEAIKLYSNWKDFTVERKIHFAMSFFNLGEIYLNLKDNKNAIENYKQSFEVYQNLTEQMLEKRGNRANLWMDPEMKVK